MRSVFNLTIQPPLLAQVRVAAAKAGQERGKFMSVSEWFQLSAYEKLEWDDKIRGEVKS